LFSLVLAG
uniref:Sex pheromone CAD1 n=1 Tax=Enterococcus faecalis TaxID=1351 RepID=CAD1_ENTFL|nr:RecName: Full=Sex pheromone CAD1 [Enterococcus faecalis]